MAWTATLTSITKDSAAKKITTVVTINGGSEPYIMTFIQNFSDVRLNQTQMISEIREFIAKMKDIEAMYVQLKALEGNNIPLNL